MATTAKYPISERVQDYSIKAVSFLFGTVHFAGRLTADAARECEAQTIHLIDKGVNKQMVRLRRDQSYEIQMADLKIRIAESRRVMDETYTRITKKMSTEELILAEEMLEAPAPPTA